MPFISFSRILLNSMNTYSFTYMVTNEASNELVQQQKKLDEFNIDQSCFLFFHIWIKGI